MPLARPCLRCGTKLSREPAGRPRKYCSAACRQAGNRLARLRGGEWWHEQPWYDAWQAERDRRRQDRAQQAAEAQAERDAHRKLLDSMPPDIRAGAEAARRAEVNRWGDGLALAAARIEIGALAEKYAGPLTRAALAVQLVPAGYGKVAKLLHVAASTDSDAEAAAMLSRARTLVASGDGDGMPQQPRSAAEEIRRFLATG